MFIALFGTILFTGNILLVVALSIYVIRKIKLTVQRTTKQKIVLYCTMVLTAFVGGLLALFLLQEFDFTNYFFSSMEGGGLLTPVVGSAIDRYGFQNTFLVAGCIIVVLTLICLPLLGRRDSSRLRRAEDPAESKR